LRGQTDLEEVSPAERMSHVAISSSQIRSSFQFHPGGPSAPEASLSEHHDE
jgi:hypothetical protein